MCLGKRFALMQVKLALATLLSQLRFVATPRTSHDPELGDMFLLQTKEVRVGVEDRGRH